MNPKFSYICTGWNFKTFTKLSSVIFHNGCKDLRKLFETFRKLTINLQLCYKCAESAHSLTLSCKFGLYLIFLSSLKEHLLL